MESIIADIFDIYCSWFQDLLEPARYTGKCLSPKSYMNYVFISCMKFQMIQYLLYPICYSSFAIHYTCIYKFQLPNQGAQTIVCDLVDRSNTSNSE